MRLQPSTSDPNDWNDSNKETLVRDPKNAKAMDHNICLEVGTTTAESQNVKYEERLSVRQTKESSPQENIIKSQLFQSLNRRTHELYLQYDTWVFESESLAKKNLKEREELIKEKQLLEQNIADLKEKSKTLEDDRNEKVLRLRELQAKHMKSSGNNRLLPSTSNIQKSFDDLKRKIESCIVTLLTRCSIHDSKVDDLLRDSNFLDCFKGVIDQSNASSYEDLLELFYKLRDRPSREAKELLNCMMQGVMHEILRTKIMDVPVPGLNPEETLAMKKIFTAISEGDGGQGLKAARQWQANTFQRLCYWADPKNLNKYQEQPQPIREIAETFQFIKYNTVAELYRALAPFCDIQTTEGKRLRRGIEDIVQCAFSFGITIKSQISTYRIVGVSNSYIKDYESVPDYSDESPLPSTMPYFYVTSALVKCSDEDGEDFEPEVLIPPKVFATRVPATVEPDKDKELPIPDTREETSDSGSSELESERSGESDDGKSIQDEDKEALADNQNRSKNNGKFPVAKLEESLEGTNDITPGSYQSARRSPQCRRKHCSYSTSSREGERPDCEGCSTGAKGSSTRNGYGENRSESALSTRRGSIDSGNRKRYLEDSTEQTRLKRESPRSPASSARTANSEYNKPTISRKAVMHRGDSKDDSSRISSSRMYKSGRSRGNTGYSGSKPTGTSRGTGGKPSTYAESHHRDSHDTVGTVHTSFTPNFQPTTENSRDYNNTTVNTSVKPGPDERAGQSPVGRGYSTEFSHSTKLTRGAGNYKDRDGRQQWSGSGGPDSSAASGSKRH